MYHAPYLSYRSFSSYIFLFCLPHSFMYQSLHTCIPSIIFWKLCILCTIQKAIFLSFTASLYSFLFTRVLTIYLLYFLLLLPCLLLLHLCHLSTFVSILSISCSQICRNPSQLTFSSIHLALCPTSIYLLMPT